MKKFLVQILYAVLVLLNACTLEEISTVPTVTLTTGTVNLSTLAVTGTINALGDGITHHGHVWSAANNPPTFADNKSDLGEKLQQGNYTSTITLFNATSTYVRGYAQDVHGRYFYGEVVTIGKINADFSIANNNCQARCTMTFTNLSTANATSYSWNFGDGTAESTLPNPTHEYSTPGTYSVTLIASASGIIGGTITKQVTVSLVTFEKTYLDFGLGRQIIQLPNEGFVIAGANVNPSTGEGDIYLVFIDKKGEITGEKIFNVSSQDVIGNMIMLSSGALAIVGSTLDPATGYTDLLYVKTDLTGTPLVGPMRIPMAEGNDSAYDIVEITDCNLTIGCGVVIVGQVVDKITGEFFVHVAKINSQADLSFFSKTIPGSGGKNGFDIMTSGNDLFVVGNGFTNAGVDAFLWKLDYKGDLLPGFPKSFNTNVFDNVYSIVKNSSGDLMMCGGTSISDLAHSKIYLIKTDASGNLFSPFPLSLGSGSDSEFASTLIVENDNNVLVIGSRKLNAYAIKLSTTGVKIWDCEFGGTQYDNFASGLSTPDGGYIFVGSKDQALYVVKTNSQGKL